MLGPDTGLHVFWSNALVGTITTLALIMLFWPLVPHLASLVRRRGRRGNVRPDYPANEHPVSGTK
jgi:hypothetical protein